MPSNSNKANLFDAIILGAGGAGLMCAGVAARRGRRVLVIDHASEPGRKILISGGGRCNFTNINTSAENYICTNPHFVKSALGRFSPQDFIDLVEGFNIAWHEKEQGQLFCDGSARQILDMLLAECGKGDVTFSMGKEIDQVSFSGGLYQVNHAGRTSRSPALVIATGGASIPKMGASGFAWDLARQFGLKVVEPVPGLVPLKLDDEEFSALSGLSCDVVLKSGNRQFRGAMLFTHRGLSGPATLQISSYWRKGDALDVDFLPHRKKGWLIDAKRSNPRATLQKVLAAGLPDRLAMVLAKRLGLSGDLANLQDRKLGEAETRLASWPLEPTGTEGFARAEVTVGGVDTAKLSSKTMEAKSRPGLYVIGEAVDVTGWLGGYNFQWAWASGVAAGRAV